MHYFEQVNIDVYDQTIACHPLIEACNASIIYRLLGHIGMACSGKTVLDAGAGTGQVTRFLKGIPGLKIEACDIDPQSETYFQQHPELKDVSFLRLNVLEDDIPRRYNAIVCRGVYHHIPKAKRPHFLRALYDHAEQVIIADEGILEYANNDERKRHCDGWYSYVIDQAKRRGITHLAEMEFEFWQHEYLNTADDEGDFKESPSHLIEDAAQVGLTLQTIDRLGPWELGGGFFTITFGP